jgi:hypothetical protein
MNRQDLINRLVARKLQAAGNAKAVCQGCWGSSPKALSSPRADAKK